MDTLFLALTWGALGSAIASAKPNILFAITDDWGFCERIMKGKKLPTDWMKPSDFEKELLD